MIRPPTTISKKFGPIPHKPLPRRKEDKANRERDDALRVKSRALLLMSSACTALFIAIVLFFLLCFFSVPNRLSIPVLIFLWVLLTVGIYALFGEDVVKGH